MSLNTLLRGRVALITGERDAAACLPVAGFRRRPLGEFLARPACLSVSGVCHNWHVAVARAAEPPSAPCRRRCRHRLLLPPLPSSALPQAAAPASGMASSSSWQRRVPPP